MKKILFMAVLVLSIAAGVTAFASSGDVTDEDFYDVLKSVDFHGEEIKEWHEGNNTANARVGYAKENDGNIFLYAKGNGTTASKAYQWPSYNGRFSDTNKAFHMGTSGEYVLQWRVKFTLPEKSGSVSYQIRMGCGGVDSSGLAVQKNPEFVYYIPAVKTYDSETEAVQYYNITGGSTTSAKTTTSLNIALKEDQWYTFRAIYNIDTRKTSLSILDTDGTWKTTGDVDFPSNWQKLDLAFIALRCDMTGDKGYSIDDFVISKITNKPVTVKYDNTKGSITYNGSAVVSEAETAVPYNSATPAAFSIAAKDGYKVSDVKVNGEYLGSADIDSYSFTNVKSAQTLEVTFDEVKTEAPEIAKSSILPTTYKVTEGETEKTYPAFVVYGTLSNYASDYNGEYGIYLWKGNGNRDSDALRLVVHADDENVASATAKQAFAIKLFGDAINSGSEYSAQAFVDNATGEKLSVTVE